MRVQQDQAQKYTEKIRERFPAIEFANVDLITTGWDHDVLIVDQQLVFRFPKTDEYKARFRNEAPLLDYTSGISNIPVPKYEYLSPEEPFGGYPMLSGTEMTTATFSKLTNSQKERIAVQLGEFLSLFHQTPLLLSNQFGYTDRSKEVWYSKEKAEQTLAALQSVLFSRLDHEEVAWISRQYQAFLSLSHDYEPCLTHSDFSAKHILIDPASGNVTGIIDFGDVEISDPSIDFSIFWIYGESFPETVYAHYRGEKDPDLLERSKFPRLTYMVRRMLEISQGINLPVSFDGSRKLLNQAMDNSLTL